MTTDLFSSDPGIYKVRSKAAGPAGSLPLTAEMLLERPSGDLFGMTQNAGMGWNPQELNRKQFLILSTQGGMRAPDGSPIALGFHTGHWEIGLLVKEAADELRRLEGLPFAAYCSDPCDGRTQGTTGMFDSLPYRNDAAVIFRRLIRSLPTRRGVLGVATCDKGLPAMMMALAGTRDLPCVLAPGGVTLPPTDGEDAGKVQTLGARFSHGLISLQEAADAGCRACASPGGGCQFLGTAATSQVVAEALGMAVPHSALAPSGEPVWTEIATRSARALVEMERRGIKMRDILTDAAIRNAMVLHAAFGGSTNLLLHIPAIAHAAGLRRPMAEDWIEVNRSVPRLVDVLPNGPTHHPTVRVFLAGGVPEVMLHLRALGVLDTSVLTVTGQTLAEVLRVWEKSERRERFRKILFDQDGVNPDDVILPPARARERGLTSTVTFPKGNLAPEGSVIKSTAIDPSVVGPDGIYRKEGPARVFTSEREAMAAIKSGKIQAGDILALIGCGPIGTGMEETYQLTSALKHLPHGKEVALITDARFSGVSTGACIGHVGPEALAGGPIGKLREGDRIRIVVDRNKLEGSVDFVGADGETFSREEGAAVLAARESRPGLAPNSALPEDTRLWAALQQLGGGTWGGCVYDADAVIKALSSVARILIFAFLIISARAADSPYKNLSDFGLSPTNSASSNKLALQQAIDWAEPHGAALFLDPSEEPYPVDGGIVLKRNVSIIGVHGPVGRGTRHPQKEQPVGSVFRIEDESSPFIFVESATQLRGLQFWYPKQTLRDPEKIIKYPATIQLSKNKPAQGVTLSALTFYGEYLAMDFNATRANPCEQILIEHCYGYPLGGEFVRIDYCYDIPRILHCHVNPSNQRFIKGGYSKGVVDAVVKAGTFTYAINHTDNAVLMDVFTFGVFGGVFLGSATYGQLSNFNLDCVTVGIHKHGDGTFNRNWQIAQGSIIANAAAKVEDIHPIIVEGQGHTALANVEAFSGGNGALTTLGKSQDFLLVRGDKKLTVSMVGCRMRDYVADAPITRLNTNSLIQAVACVDKAEQFFNATFPEQNAKP